MLRGIGFIPYLVEQEFELIFTMPQRWHCLQDHSTLAGRIAPPSCHLQQHIPIHGDPEQVSKYGKVAYKVICVIK